MATTCISRNVWNVFFIRSGVKSEEQKSSRKLEAEWRQLSSSHPKSLEGGRSENKTLDGSAPSRPCLKSRPLLMKKRNTAVDEFQPDVPSRWKKMKTRISCDTCDTGLYCSGYLNLTRACISDYFLSHSTPLANTSDDPNATLRSPITSHLLLDGLPDTH